MIEFMLLHFLQCHILQKCDFLAIFSIQKCDFALINSIQKCDLNKNNIKKKDWQVPSGLENRVDKMPSIISGVRQIGKTTSIREFGQTYKSFIEINLVTKSY